MSLISLSSTAQYLKTSFNPPVDDNAIYSFSSRGGENYARWTGVESIGNIFSLECWFYTTTRPIAPDAPNIFTIGNHNLTTGISIILDRFTSTRTYDRIRIQNTGGGIQCSYEIPSYLNTWNHIAFSVSGTSVTCYINGLSRPVQELNTRNSSSLTGGNFHVFSRFGNVTAQRRAPPITSLVSNIRVAKKIIYTGNFTPPTTKLMAIQSAGTNINSLVAGDVVVLFNNNTFNSQVGSLVLDATHRNLNIVSSPAPF